MSDTTKPIWSTPGAQAAVNGWQAGISAGQAGITAGAQAFGIPFNIGAGFTGIPMP